MAEIPQEHDFLIWGIQTFVRKVKQFVRKGVCVPQPSALGPISSPLGPKIIARLNTIVLFNFEVVITLKL